MTIDPPSDDTHATALAEPPKENQTPEAHDSSPGLGSRFLYILPKFFIPILLIMALLFAVWVSQYRFPWEKAPHLHIWILALSVYASMWAALVALWVNLGSIARSKTNINWEPPWTFAVYLFLNLFPLIWASEFLNELSFRLKSSPCPPLESIGLGLKIISVTVTVVYLLADAIGKWYDKDKPTNDAHRTMLKIDLVVLAVHCLMVIVLTCGDHIPILKLYKNELQPFAAGMMGVALIMQNLLFAIITYRSHGA